MCYAEDYKLGDVVTFGDLYASHNCTPEKISIKGYKAFFMGHLDAQNEDEFFYTSPLTCPFCKKKVRKVLIACKNSSSKVYKARTNKRKNNVKILETV